MRFPLFTSVMQLLGLWAPVAAAPLVAKSAPVIKVRPIIDCAFVEIAEAPETQAAAATDIELPTAGTVDEAAERTMVASIGAHAAMTAVATPRREPEDFILARRLEVIARMNRPVVQLNGPAVRADGQRRGKKSRPGTLSPVLARGTRPTFATPLAAAA